jgi:hypothetical protein
MKRPPQLVTAKRQGTGVFIPSPQRGQRNMKKIKSKNITRTRRYGARACLVPCLSLHTRAPPTHVFQYSQDRRPDLNSRRVILTASAGDNFLFSHGFFAWASFAFTISITEPPKALTAFTSAPASSSTFTVDNIGLESLVVDPPKHQFMERRKPATAHSVRIGTPPQQEPRNRRWVFVIADTRVQGGLASLPPVDIRAMP